MFKLFPIILFWLSVASHGQDLSDVRLRITEAFNKRAADDFLIGSSVGYIDQQGSLQLSLGTVQSSHEKFEIGSVSKSFTGIILAQLIIENKAKLTTPLEAVISELQGTFAGSLTLKLLATHKARLVRDHPAGDRVSEEDIINFLKTYTPGQDAPAEGEKRYSNLGFDTLGLVISRLTGKSYSDAVRERIFLPLGMNESGFLTSVVEHSSLITPHNILLQPTSADILSDLPGASGGITSSLNDMMKFLELNYNPDEAVKLAQKECLGFDNNPGEGYVWKNGGMTGFSSLMLIDTVNKRATMVLSNSKNSSSATRLGLIAVGENDGFRPDTKIPADISSGVIGRYYNDDFKFYLDVVTTRAGFLGFVLRSNLQSDNSWATRLYTDDQKKFFLKGSGWTDKDYVEFRLNPETGEKEVILREFDQNDENGNPVYSESIFTFLK
jgi:CubicO group peptidase (beta-lactamase class C family)